MSSARAPNDRASPADREMRDVADITLEDAPDDGASLPRASILVRLLFVYVVGDDRL